MHSWVFRNRHELRRIWGLSHEPSPRGLAPAPATAPASAPARRDATPREPIEPATAPRRRTLATFVLLPHRRA